MISRQWRCLAHPNRAQDYVKHLRTETFPTMRNIPGFVDASLVSRPLGAGVEFLVVTGGTRSTRSPSLPAPIRRRRWCPPRPRR